MITPPWYDNPIEEVAFNAYALNTQRLEDVVDELIQLGCTSFTIEGLSENELEYVRQRLEDYYND